MSGKWDSVDDLPEELQTPDQRRRETTAASPNGPRNEGSVPGTDGADQTADPDAGPGESLDISSHQEFVERQVLEDIFRARRNAREALSEAPVRAQDEGADPVTLEQYVYGRVWSLVSLVRPYLLDTEIGSRYWTDEHVGSFVINGPRPSPSGEMSTRPSDEIIDVAVAGAPETVIDELPVVTQDNSPFGGFEDPQPPSSLTVSLQGLSDYLALDAEIEVSWKVGVEATRRGSRTTEVDKRMTAPPMRISRNAYDLADQALADLGLSAQLDDAEGAGFDLEDL